MQNLYLWFFYFLFFIVLCALSISDYRTRIIYPRYIRLLLLLGIIHVIFDYKNWINNVCGFFSVSVVLFLIHLVSKGRLIGGGDVKMMAACGMILGQDLIWYAFFIGCVIGLVAHSIAMIIWKVDKSLPMGPYFSIGIFVVIMSRNLIFYS